MTTGMPLVAGRATLSAVKAAARTARMVMIDRHAILAAHHDFVIMAVQKMGMMPAAPEDAVKQHRDERDQAGNLAAHFMHAAGRLENAWFNSSLCSDVIGYRAHRPTPDSA